MSFLEPHLDGFFSSPDEEGGIRHWHIRFVNTDIGVAMLVDRDKKQLEVTNYLFDTNARPSQA